MSEEEWLVCQNAFLMVAAVPFDARKFRLFICACFREFEQRAYQNGDDNRDTVRRTEENPGVYTTLDSGWARVMDEGYGLAKGASDVISVMMGNENIPSCLSADLVREVFGNPFRGTDYSWVTRQVVSLAEAAYRSRRKVPCRWHRGWCQSCDNTGWEEDGPFDRARLAVLSDAVEEACGEVRCPWCGGGEKKRGLCPSCRGSGFVTSPIVDHLRSPNNHYRGCHVVDSILGFNAEVFDGELAQGVAGRVGPASE